MNVMWTDDEDALIRMYWDVPETIESWAYLLPLRTSGGIYQRGRDIGLGKRPYVSRKRENGCWMAVKIALEKKTHQTAYKLSVMTGYSESRINYVLKEHKDKGVYIVDFVQEYCTYAAVWASGEGRSKKWPKKASAKEKQQKYLKRAMERNPERFDRINARKRLKQAEESGKLIRPDPAAAWMFN